MVTSEKREPGRSRTAPTSSALFRRVLGEARPYWPHIGAIFVVSMLSTPLALLAPIPLKIVVDNVIVAKPLPDVIDAILPASATHSSSSLLVAAVILLVGIALLQHLQLLATNVLGAYTGERILLNFRGRLFRHAQRLSLGFHDTKGTAHSVYRIQYDGPAIHYLAIDATVPLLTSALTVVAMIVVVFRIDWQLALVALAVSPGLFWLSRAYQQPLRRRYRTLGELETQSLGVVQEVLSAVRVVKAFGAEDREQQRFLTYSGAGMWARIRLAWFEGGLGLLLGLTTAVGSALVLFIGVRHVQSGSISLGELLIVMAYLSQLYTPLQTISSKFADVQGSLSSAERAFGLLDAHQDVEDSVNGVSVNRVKGAVAYRNVSFGYERDRPVLKGITFVVPAGTQVGIAGTTGAGKSTIVSLLTRFYDPTEGHILLDGVDLRDYRLADLRNQFSIVLQDPLLFSTTIAENIAYAKPEATEAEIIAAASAANAHDFVTALPDGYHTQVGERGMRLSGGERQRISLARAFLKDAPILILDEPTSSVDVKTEEVIMDAMQRLMRNRTTFMIAHRLSTLEMCDLRLQVENGQLVTIAAIDWATGHLVDGMRERPANQLAKYEGQLCQTLGQPGLSRMT